MRKLDRLIQKAVIGEYDCVPVNMIIDDNELEIPDMFDIDIRQNNSKFMESCIREVIENMFRIRLKYEE